MTWLGAGLCWVCCGFCYSFKVDFGFGVACVLGLVGLVIWFLNCLCACGLC